MICPDVYSTYKFIQEFGLKEREREELTLGKIVNVKSINVSCFLI